LSARQLRGRYGCQASGGGGCRPTGGWGEASGVNMADGRLRGGGRTEGEVSTIPYNALLNTGEMH
jgi:hypothetical protein